METFKNVNYDSDKNINFYPAFMFLSEESYNYVLERTLSLASK